MEELILKVEVFLQRSRKTVPSTPAVFQAGGYTFDPGNLVLKKGTVQVGLTRREAELLRYFIQNREKVLKREQILKAVWGSDDYFLGRSLDVFVSRLRKILQEEKIVIQNFHGVGFKYSEKE